MDEAGEPNRDIDLVTLLVGAVTGQDELSEADRRAVGEWMLAHVHEPKVHDLLTKIVMTQIGDTSEWRVAVAEAIRQQLEPASTEAPADQNA